MYPIFHHTTLNLLNSAADFSGVLSMLVSGMMMCRCMMQPAAQANPALCK